MASNKATMTYVVDDLEGNFECSNDAYDSITDVFDEIASHLQGEYDDDEGNVGEVKTTRVKKIEIWINHATDTQYQESKPELKWEIKDTALVASDACEIEKEEKEEEETATDWSDDGEVCCKNCGEWGEDCVGEDCETLEEVD